MAGQKMQGNPHLSRCELCCHGPDCGILSTGDCGYSHKLEELMPPNEADSAYIDVWKDSVHRWYGQCMQQWVVKRIIWYYNMEPFSDITRLGARVSFVLQ